MNQKQAVAKPPASREVASQKRPHTETITIEDGDDDDLVELTKPKRAKTEPKGVKSAFFEKKETKSSPTKKVVNKPVEKKSRRRIVVDSDEDSGDDFVPDAADEEEQDVFQVIDVDDNDNDNDELDALPPPSDSKKAKRATRSSASPVKAPPKEETLPSSPVKKKPTKKSTPIKSAKVNAGVTAWDVLAKIPDAELPEEISTGEGFNFRDFKARQSTLPQGSGDIEIPEGAPNCLTGLTIVFTGVMENLSREDAENLAKKYGAKVTKSISSKTSVVVLGEEAGPSKVKKIKQFKIKAINEAGFLKLIAGMPEEGGDGEAAEKARIKRMEEEQKALEESIQMQKEADADAKKREADIKKAKETGNISNSGKLKTDDEKLWTVKYAPTNLDQICGNKSSVAKLKTWLEEWPRKFSGKPGKGETDFRAVLIHGPPGIGKTTAAHLVAKSLGYDVLEKNASDVRSKGLLNSTVGEILDNTSVVGFFNSSKAKNANKMCIIMDEVDGMSGGDRGGVGQLASFCRKTQAPLILICNDKSLPKMRPFDRVTLDVPFRRPQAREMKSRLMTIALREHIKLDPNIIDQLVSATSNDIRQIINLLSTVSKTQKSIDSSNTKGITQEWQKNIALKPFDIIPRLLGGQAWIENSPVPLFKKMEMYFDDFQFVPLMMQENYLNTRPNKGATKLAHLELAANAADSLSEGDLVDSKIHSAEQLWSLMPLHSIMSTVRPASFVAGQVSGRINFAAWFGQNSKTGKYKRLLNEIQYSARLRTSTDAVSLRLEYIPVLYKRLLDPILTNADNISEVINILDHYFLSKSDWDYLMEFLIGNDDTTARLKKIPTQTKSKFTRQYNASVHPTAIHKPGVTVAVKQGKKKSTMKLDEKEEAEEPLDDEVGEEDIIDE